MLSFVVPAHNEERLLPLTLASIRQACEAQVWPYEVVVVSDACSDATAEVARQAGARVLEVDYRHIARTRNAGAAAAEGQYLFFIDADTQIDSRYLLQALNAMRAGAVGGGARFRFDGELPAFARPLMLLLDWICRLFQVAGGCCLFCRREAFEAVGGFDSTLFAGEELQLARQLKRVGRFRVIEATVLTSGRKIRDYSARELLGVIWGVLRKGRQALKNRDGLDLWYRRR